MVFWKTYPLLNVIQAKFNREIFKSQIFDRESIESPTGTKMIIVRKNYNEHIVSEIRDFIKNNFGSPPKTPIYNIPNRFLLSEKDHILVVKDIDRLIVGCVRFHFLGTYASSDNEEIYCVDCFTVNKKWRGKGLGDYLLTYLHTYVNNNNIPYCMFLKEGFSLSIVHSPIYTGIYVYRELLEQRITENIKDLSVVQAYRLMDLFREINPRMFIIRNIKSENQKWKIYKKDKNKILACFQDAFQSFEEDKKIKKIGWCTGWIESSGITDEFREEASRELSASMFPEFNYIWMNKEWVGNEKIWKVDGPFNWYTYQWTSAINIKNSYCILN
jgi:N-acetylglutamate synthase-like GNAT family acetyltransferase